MAPPLVGPMSQFFTSHDMHSTYQYPNLRQVREIKPSTAPHLTPYLGSRSRLSQVWFNRWTVLLALIIVKIFLSTQSLDNDINSAQREALSACTSVERAGSAMASMPHYMSQGVNELTATAIEASVRALQQTLTLAVSVVREIVIFVINMLVSTYVCLITFAINGSVGLVLNKTEEIGKFLNDTLQSITGSVEDEMKDYSAKLTDIFGKISEGVGNFFGEQDKLPQLTLPALDKLTQIQIPASFFTNINTMKDNLPDFQEVKKAADDVLSFPFNSIQERINGSLGIYHFDRTIFPVPPKEKLTFCSDNNNISSLFDTLKQAINKTKTTVIIILMVLAILAIIPMAYLEIRRWRIMRQRAYMFGANSNYDPVDVTYLASRPSSGTWGLRFANNIGSERRQVLVRWAVAYITSPPALFVLSLGLAGLVGALSQYFVLKQVEKAVPELAAQVGGFAGEVVDLLNNSSAKFADSTNAVLQDVTDELNDNVFGWITNGTQSLNDTLNTFSETMQKGIDGALGGTVLEKPAEEIINCLIGLKIEALQKGLTWLHDNAKISLPKVAPDTFSLGAMNSLSSDSPGDSFLADPESASSDMVTDALYKLSAKWQDALTTEVWISGGVVLIWVSVLVIALVRTGSLWWGTDKVRGDGGGRGTNFSGGQPPLPANVPPPSYSLSRHTSFPLADERGASLHLPELVHNRSSESLHLGTVNSRRITPEHTVAGGWIDEKRRGSITDIDNNSHV